MFSTNPETVPRQEEGHQGRAYEPEDHVDPQDEGPQEAPQEIQVGPPPLSRHFLRDVCNLRLNCLGAVCCRVRRARNMFTNPSDKLEQIQGILSLQI